MQKNYVRETSRQDKKIMQELWVILRTVTLKTLAQINHLSKLNGLEIEMIQAINLLKVCPPTV